MDPVARLVESPAVPTPLPAPSPSAAEATESGGPAMNEDYATSTLAAEVVVSATSRNVRDKAVDRVSATSEVTESTSHNDHIAALVSSRPLVLRNEEVSEDPLPTSTIAHGTAINSMPTSCKSAQSMNSEPTAVFGKCVNLLRLV